MQQGGLSFQLDPAFVDSFRAKTPPFGFDGLGHFTFLRTYSRLMPDGKTKEGWVDTLERVVNGTYSIQKDHITSHRLDWDDAKGQESAQEFFTRMFEMKFLPPGRGLWAMGTPTVHERRLGGALQNCGYVSTKGISKDFARPFCFMMDATMLGVGVGFDVDGAGTVTVKIPDGSHKPVVYQIPDTREGWVESVRKLLLSYTSGDDFTYEPVAFDYSLIRARGLPIKGFGGISSGPEPLMELHDTITRILFRLDGQPISKRAIADIMNMIGRCVVAGNVRRSAQIALGDTSSEYLNLKNYAVNPERQHFGWASNNSVRATLGMSYEDIASRIADNGEPGLFWQENITKWGRMWKNDGTKPDPAVGINPCAEQPLEDGEMCTLVETFPQRHATLDDYERTLKFAYLYAKTVTLVNTHWGPTNRVMAKNRRIGLSMSGIAQFASDRGLAELRRWCASGYDTVRYYDDVYSSWMGIKNSIRVTTIKPSGTVSLLAGATPGVHFPEAPHYLRRVRIQPEDPLVAAAKSAGYRVEAAIHEPNTAIVEFPVSVGQKVRPVHEVSMWEQLELAALMQSEWSDNAVSVTVSFDKEKEGRDIVTALDHFQYRLKTVSFLPRGTHGFEQVPYEPISRSEYEARKDRLKPLKLKGLKDAEAERFCDADSCAI